VVNFQRVNPVDTTGLDATLIDKARNKTQKLIQDSLTTAAATLTKTIYTTPASTVFYLTSCTFSAVFSGASGSGPSGLRLVISSTAYPIMEQITGQTAAAGVQNFNQVFPMPLKLTAANTIEIYGHWTNGISSTFNATCQGWEESV